MSRMTIEQAISHAREVAEKNRANCERNTIIIPNRWISDTQCAAEHEQLAEWLEELKRYRELKEQGRLIELPCKPHELVYAAHKVFPIRQTIYCSNEHIVESIEAGYAIGYTQEAAKAKLKEMEGVNE